MNIIEKQCKAIELVAKMSDIQKGVLSLANLVTLFDEDYLKEIFLDMAEEEERESVWDWNEIVILWLVSNDYPSSYWLATVEVDNTLSLECYERYAASKEDAERQSRLIMLDEGLTEDINCTIEIKEMRAGR